MLCMPAKSILIERHEEITYLTQPHQVPNDSEMWTMGENIPLLVQEVIHGRQRVEDEDIVPQPMEENQIA